MSSDIQSLSKLKEGWKETQSGGLLHQKIEPGQLSTLLHESFGDKLEYNLLSLHPEVDRVPLPMDLVDNFYVHLSERGWKSPKIAASDALIVAAQKNSYHPVAEFLNEIEFDDSIQPIDLNSVATCYLETKQPLYDSMLKAVLIASVARVLKPGIKFDNCLVLKGSQEIGKSSFWKAISSDEWFCDTWQDRDQDLYMAIQTCWFYELAELDSMTSKKDQGAIKAMLSSSVDTFKRPYARGIGRHPRPSVMVASCNRHDFLNDPTGSRRFWVIDLPQQPEQDQRIDIDRVLRDRKRILKAAILAYRKEEKPILTTEEQNQSNRLNDLYEAEHPFFTRLYDWINADLFEMNYGEAKGGFTTETALIKSGCREENSIRMPDLKDAASCLRQLGFEKGNQTRKAGTKQPRKWTRLAQVTQVNENT